MTDYNPQLCVGIELQHDAAQAVGLQVSHMTAIDDCCVGALEMAGWVTPRTAREIRSWLSAIVGVTEQLTATYGKPEFDLPVTVAKVEGRETTFGSLLHFERDTDRRDPKVYVVAPTSGHFSTLLTDTVRQLLPDHDVYMTDCNDVANIPLDKGDFGLDDYIQNVQDDLRVIGPDCHVLAICQSTVPVLAALADMAKHDGRQPALSLTLMAGPIDVAAAPTAVTKFADGHDMGWFQRNLIGKVTLRHAGAGRLVYPGDLQLGAFVAMNVPKHVRAFEDLFLCLAAGDQVGADKITKFYTEYQSVASMSATFYLETVLKIFKERQLARGVMRRDNGDLIEPSYLTMPLLTIEGGKDDICAPGQTTAAHALCASRVNRHYLQPEVGHYGCFSGRLWQQEIAPRFAAFIREAAERTVPSW
jgi:poly(3-hydroxybutyrate) depolymerase